MGDTRYFVVHLTDGTSYDFNMWCNNVDFKDEKVCIFNHLYKPIYNSSLNPATKQLTLAMIPYESIKTILSYERSEQHE